MLNSKQNMEDKSLIFYLDEIKKGLILTGKYFLSHHDISEYHKCYHISVFDKNIYICSRCLGGYFGLTIGILIALSNLLNPILSLILIAIFPCFTAIDKSLSIFFNIEMNNLIRTVNGFFLGIAYSFSIFLLINNVFRIHIFIIGFCYLLIAFILIKVK